MTSKANSITMQPKNYLEHCHKLKYPCAVQEKLNGMRCLAQWVNGSVMLRFRSNDIITTLPHLNTAIEAVLPDDAVLDGELYNPLLSFGSLSSLIRATVNRKATSEVQLHVFDLVSVDNFIKRHKELTSIIHEDISGLLKTVPYLNVSSQADINHCYHRTIKEGGEGIVIRETSIPYIFGKTDKCLKYKPTHEGEFEIIGVNEGKGKLLGHVGAFVCKTSDNEVFKVKPSGPQRVLKELLKEQEDLVGNILTVKYYDITERGGSSQPSR